MKSAGKLFSGVILIGSGAILGKGSEYISRIMVSRWLGPEMLGNLTLVFSIFVILTGMCVMELTAGTMHFGRQYTDQDDPEAVRRILVISLATSMFVSFCVSFWLLFFDGSNVIADAFNATNLQKYFLWVAVALPTAAVFHFYFNHLLAMHKRKMVIWIREIFCKGGRILGIVVIIFTVQSLEGLVGVYLLSVSLPGVLGVIYFFRTAGKPRISSQAATLTWRSAVGKMISYSWPLTISGIMLNVSRRFDILSVGFFLSSKELGLYSIAIINSAIFILFNYVLNEVFLPIASTLTGKGKREELASLYKVSVCWCAYIVLPIALILIVRASAFIEIVSGKEFIPAATAMQILTLGYMTVCLEGPLPAMILALELSRFVLIIRSVMIVSAVALNILLVPRYGLLGAATAMTITQVNVRLTRLFLLYHETGIHPFTKRLIFFLGTAGACMIVALFIMNSIARSSLYFIALELFVCMLVAFLVLWKIVGFSRQDLEIIRSCINHIKNVTGAYST